MLLANAAEGVAGLVQKKQTATGVNPATGLPTDAFSYKASAPGPIPGSAQVGMTYNAAKAAYQRALQGLNKNRLDLAQQWGYQGDLDPETGSFSNLRVDQHNQYGGYQLARRGHAQQYDQLRNAVAERRIGRKGLAAQDLSDLRFDWGNEDQASARSILNSLSGFDSQQQEAYQGFQNTYHQALLDAARQAIEDARYNEAEYDDGGDADDDVRSPAGAKKKSATKLVYTKTPDGRTLKTKTYKPTAASKKAQKVPGYYVPGGATKAQAKAAAALAAKKSKTKKK